MPRIQSHYEVLKVARDAPAEFVRAAYRVLAQQNHPDRNGGTPKSEEVMAILNEAYRILSNETLRAEHDDWIRRQEEFGANVAEPTTSAQASPFRAQQKKPSRHWRANTQDDGIDLDEEFAKFKLRAPYLLLVIAALSMLIGILTIGR